MNVNLREIRSKTLSVKDYIENLKEPFRGKFLARKQTYVLNPEAVNKLKNLAKEYVIVVFSAEWCKDCAANIPVLTLISEATGLEVRIFGGLMKDPLSHTRKWRIPPSPSEVERFQVDKIPFIIVFDKNGVEIGRVIENPKKMPTLEQEILQIISEHATD
ncbi:MAG: thioredoxin family protein [Candidatus Bathycorpusculaceae bacterium]